MSQPESKIRRVQFDVEEEVLQVRREISIVTQKLDILADKLAENTALLKVSFDTEKEISGAVPVPLKTEEELDEFENSLTPELIGFYASIEQGRLVLHIYLQTKKISKIIGSEPLSKRFKLIIAEDIINDYNLDGSNGKKSLRCRIGLYGVLKGALAKDSEDPDKSLRKAMTNVKNKLTKQKHRNNNCGSYEKEENMVNHRSAAQDAIFLRFIRENIDIAKGFTRGDRVLVTTLWKDLSSEFNAHGPPCKTDDGKGQVRVLPNYSLKGANCHERQNRGQLEQGRDRRFWDMLLNQV
ncbi:uncharacterized protein LOC119559692 [Drosophila subpulchrella]|uniref:uncharacterized protein LOC119559692 n=1 Tax=Drosophila subpulchrella TaxID=1486046 RepID=UPI0018A19EAD|nr:uncharacterized protein LOC119559692 [Drosophila subpulchrella]